MDMNALLDSLVSDRQDMGQDVMLEGHCRQPWTVRPNSLRRCLTNLLDNALRYSARVRIRLLEKADVLQIDVLDDGPGIPPEMLEQVFEPFFPPGRGPQPPYRRQRPGPEHRPQHGLPQRRELSLHNRPEGGLCARLCLYRSAMETEASLSPAAGRHRRERRPPPRHGGEPRHLPPPPPPAPRPRPPGAPAAPGPLPPLPALAPRPGGAPGGACPPGRRRGEGGAAAAAGGGGGGVSCRAGAGRTAKRGGGKNF